MKKIIKKIGVLGIIIAMIIPFIKLPTVNAVNENCTDHTLQQYMFLDVTNGNYWRQYTSNGYATYTSYANLFPVVNDNQRVNILRVGIINDFVNSSSLSTNQASLPKFYGAVNSVLYNSDYKGNKVLAVGDYTKKDTSKYALETILHGYWARESSTNRSKLETAGWFDNVKDELNLNDSEMETYFIEHSIQYVLNTSDKIIAPSSSEFYVDIQGARKSGTSSYIEEDGYDLIEFLDAVANRTNDDLIYTDDEDEYFSLRINRFIDKDVLNDLTFGYDDDEGNFYAFSEIEGSIKNSYSALLKYNANKTTGVHSVPIDEDDIDIRTDLQYYWPAILTVEYNVCETDNPVDPADPVVSKWELKYDDNVSDNSVTNMPSPKSVKENLGEYIEVSSTKPKREGYAFKGWCQDAEECSDIKKAGDKIVSNTAKTITLFAQWGKTGTSDQEPTGVISYVIGFISVGIVAGGIYLLAKKKNLFKQI